MAIKGELFSQQFIPKLLDRSKTRTSRPPKPHKGNFIKLTPTRLLAEYRVTDLETCQLVDLCKPKYQPGDIIYVRETFQYISPDENYRPIDECSIIYKATDEHPGFEASEYCEVHCLKHEPDNDVVYPWHPSIHMPREAARIFLRVTDVKAQNIADVTEQDAVEDGFKYLLNFRTFWRETYGTESPWMWVYYFEPISKEAALNV